MFLPYKAKQGLRVVYKKYRYYKGKKLGPYYYESLRLPDGTVKTIYHGTTSPGKVKPKAREVFALQKLNVFRKIPNILTKIPLKLFIILVLVLFLSFGAYLGVDYYTNTISPTGFAPVSLEDQNLQPEVVELLQAQAEIGKPVEWLQIVEIPSDEEENIEKYAPEGTNVTSYTKASSKITGFLTAKEPKTEYKIKFTTPAPQKSEEEPATRQGKWAKKVLVSSDASIHYYNVKSYTEIPETPEEKVRLYHKIDGKKVEITRFPEYSVKKIDTNENGLIDRLEWNVPMLSEQEFEVEIDITVLNVQSYPELGGNWTVAFTTTGTATLTITKDEKTAQEISFEFLKCGNEIIEPIIDGPSVIVENWNCDNKTASIEHTVDIAGKHSQHFVFGTAEAWAYNDVDFPAVGDYVDDDPPYSIDNPAALFVSGDYAYVTSSPDNSLTIIDISDKTNPVATGEYIDSATPNSIDAPFGVFVLGDYAYVTSFDDDSLTIINITDKTNPVATGDYTDTVPPNSVEEARDVFVLGDYAYVTSSADDSLTIIDITDKTNPVAAGDYVDEDPPNSIENPWEVFVLGNYAYVTSYVDDSLTIIDVSDKTTPVAAGDYVDDDPPNSIDAPYGVFVSGNYA